MFEHLTLLMAITTAILIALGIVLAMWTIGKCLQYLIIWKAAKEQADRVLKRKR